MTRILCVNPGLHMGGAEHSLLLLLDGLRAHGILATVALFGPGAFEDRLGDAGIRTSRVRAHRSLRRASRYGPVTVGLGAAAFVGFSIAAALDLVRLARRERADLIHTNGLKAHLMGAFAARVLGKPVVWHVRDFPPPGLPGRVLKQAARRFPSIVIANSEAVASAIATNSRTPVRTLHNPVDLERFRPDVSGRSIRHELNVPEGAPLIGLVAHLTPWKGHGLFLQVARQVADRMPTSRFVIAGGAIYETDGHVSYREELIRRCAALGLNERLTFLDARDDIPQLMAALDVLVHCPEAPEPFGRSIAEAMAAGRPVVAARCGGIPEIVEEGLTGFLVPSGDVEGFTDAILKLASDSELRRRFGLAGRARAEAMFSPDAHVRAVIDAYRQILPGLALTA